MRIKYPILLFFAIGVAVSACRNRPATHANPLGSSVPVEKKSPGKIEFTEEMHNFGTLKEGEIVAYSFQFRNNGGAPFRLSRVDPTCGCLSVQYDRTEISEKKSSFIEVIFHTEGEWGNQIKTVDIETSNGESKTLTIGAYVENKNFNIDLNSLK